MGNVSEQQRLNFIQQIAVCAMKAYGILGKIYPSVCIGMAIVECKSGTAGSVKYHSYLGQKVGTGKTATKYWGGKAFSSKTKEEYTVGVHSTITAAFRSYESMEQCVMNYYELLNTSLYAKVQAGVDYATQMKQIKDCKYMTSSTEVNSVIKLIQQYNLTQYDKMVGADSGISIPFVIGCTYTLQTNLWVRESANGEKQQSEKMTDSGKEQSEIQADGTAVLKKGTKITCQAVEWKNNQWWVKFPSGWICGMNADGKFYIK